MVSFRTVNGESFISLLELYIQLGKPPERFHRWRMKILYQNITIEKSVDYIPCSKKDAYRPKEDHKGRTYEDYLITIDLAKAICINTGTIIGRNLKKFIENERRKSYI